MSLDNYIDTSKDVCKRCGSPECGICKTCKRIIISGVTCIGCAKSGKELNGWWYNNVNHTH